VSTSWPSGGLLGGSLGLGSEGVLGAGSLGSAVDPAWEAAPTPTLAGGTIGRPITQAGPGRWLLDLDLGGQLWRIGTEEVRPLSRARGGQVVYVAGLDDLSFELDTESVSVRVRSGGADTWARQRRVLGPIRGRRFVLRLWYEGQVLEDAFVALQGVVEGAAFGSTDDPYTLELSCARDMVALSRAIVGPNQRMGDDTFAKLNTDTDGMVYPVVFGHPGEGGIPCSPALRYYDTIPGNYFVVAGHHVAASHVVLWNLSQEEDPLPGDTYPVTNTRDLLGQDVAIIGPVPASGGGAGTVHAKVDNEYAVSWLRPLGGGVRHRGRAVSGLGDLLEWGADRFSSALFDQGEMSARRESLNRFRVGGFFNELETVWQEWLESNVLNLFELEEVQGPRGVYYQEIRHSTDRRLVRGRLVTGGAGGGYRVERVAPVSESDDDIFNRITISYGPLAGSTQQYLVDVPMGAWQYNSGDHSERPPPSVILRDPRCEYSERIFGPRESKWETGLVWDAGTAEAVARTKAQRHALPKQLTVYQGGRELLDFRKHEVVSVLDLSPGAAFEDDLAIVRGVSIVDGQTVRLSVAIDTDPLRIPTVRRT
jgi:hypothetical protein